jgi:hypothetical protein
LINHPQRVVYVPGWLVVSRYAESIFGGLIDRIGPLLLKKSYDKKKQGSQTEGITR